MGLVTRALALASLAQTYATDDSRLMEVSSVR